MSVLTGIDKGVFDELYVVGANGVLNPVTGDHDDSALAARVTAVEADVSTNATAITQKQDTINTLSMGSQVQLLNSAGHLRPIIPGGRNLTFDHGTHVEIFSPQISCTAPLAIDANNAAISLDQTAFSDISCNTLNVSYGVTCGDVDCSAIVGLGAQAIANNTAAAITAATSVLEPAFLTSADLTKVLNTTASPPTITLGLSSSLEARIAALETALANQPQIETGSLTQQATVSGTQSHSVSFSQTFASAPVVTVCQQTGNAAGHVSISRTYAISVTTSGFSLVVAEEEQSGAYSLGWVAILT